MIQKIGRYRTELMGFAIIWVILFHSGIEIPIVDNLYKIGYGGVDIFFFLSGFGLFYSLKKDSGALQFYKKRVVRIFPTYLFIVLISMILLGKFTLVNYLWNISTLGFWIGKSYFEWYIPSMMVFYLLSPLFFKFIERNLNHFFIGILIITAVLISIRIGTDINKMLMLFLTRIPIFALGLIFGKWSFEKKELNKSQERIIYLLSFLAFVFAIYSVNYLSITSKWDYGVYWYPFILITPGLCGFIATALEWSNSKFTKNILAVCGALSLEIYLIHIKLFEKSHAIAEYFGVTKLLVLLVVIALIVPISQLVSKTVAVLSEFVGSKIFSKKQH